MTAGLAERAVTENDGCDSHLDLRAKFIDALALELVHSEVAAEPASTHSQLTMPIRGA